MNEPLPEPLVMSVHSMAPPDMDASSRRARIGRWKMLAILAVCASPVVASYLTYFVIRPQGRSNYAQLIEPMREIPAQLPLKTLGGQPVDARSLRGQWLLIVIGDASCDAACEQHLLLQRQMREALGRERDRVDKLWLIPDDAPVRAEVSAAVAAAPAVNVLRVPRAALAAWLEPAPGHALSDHVYVVDPMGQWMMRAPADLDRSKFKRDLDRLLRASSSWDPPGR